MHDVLDFFDLQDVIPLVLLIWLLAFVGGQMSTNEDDRWWARGFAVVGFLLYCGFAIEAWQPSRAGDFLELGVRALLAMGIVHGLARIAVPIVRFLYKHLWAEPMAKQRAWAEEKERRDAAERAACEKAEAEQAERKRQEDEQRRRQEELANRPPPPTREERMESAKQRFEKTMRTLTAAGLDEIEMKAAHERAKQQYLRDIDEALQ